jgi:hypothetical protein
MRWKARSRGRIGWFVLAVAAGCGGSGGEDPCQDVRCDDPPADTCKDASTLLEYPATGTCQPETGACSYTPVEKSCDNGCSDGRCLGGEGDAFRLVVPDGTTLCSLFQSYLGNTDIWLDHGMKGRVTLIAGTFELPLDEESFGAELIERVEFGPERAELEPLAAGRFDRTLQGTPDDGTYRFEYVKSYRAGDRTLEIVYHADFVVQGGTPERTEIVLDDQAVGNEWFDFTARLVDAADEAVDMRAYTGCGFPTYTLRPQTTLTMANGDRLTLDQRTIGDSICKLCNTGLVQATYTGDQVQREVTDFFQLAYSAQHHNWYQEFLVIFDQPVGDLHGILAAETHLELPRIRSVDYLDADLEVIDTVEVTGYDVQ